jgi:Tfp pilus assembly protein PilX
MKHIDNKQSGVTLLLAVLILSGMVLVTLAVATFSIQEMRSSRASLITEPAINAAESGAELGLWNLKRDSVSAITNCSSSQISQSFPSSKSIMGYCKSFTGATYAVTNAAPVAVYLYDPDDINGDVDLHLMADPYSTLTVNNTGNNSVSVRVYYIDNNDAVTDAVLSYSVSANTPDTRNLPGQVPLGNEGRMQVVIETAGSTTVDVNTDVGLPSSLKLASSGCSSKAVITSCSSTGQEIFSRQIEINVSSGL